MWSQVVGQFTWCHYTNIADDVNITSLKITKFPTWLYPLPVAGCLITRTRVTTEHFGHCWHQNICVFPRKLQELSCFPACKRIPFIPSTLLGYFLCELLNNISVSETGPKMVNFTSAIAHICAAVLTRIGAFQNPPTFGEYLWLSYVYDLVAG